MWFRNRHRPANGLRTPGAAYRLGALGRTEVDGSVALPPNGFFVGDTSNGEPASAKPGASTAQRQRGLWQSQAEKVRSGSRRATGHAVNGGAGPGEANSAYSLLRTQIVKRLQENGWKTVAITSPSRASGNTFTAINLAISIARDFSHTVLLVELDLVHPSFHELLGFKQHLGIVDHLLHDAPVSEILLDPGIDRLSVIPAGSPVGNASELLSSPKMGRLVDELKRRHEHQIILFDLPSVLASDAAMAFSPLVDCALLVVEEGETRVTDVRRSLDYLRSTKILGVVLNRSIHAENDGKMISG